mgnify:CR=1 FL=1
MGEPAGIGPELLVRIAQLSFFAQVIVIADPKLLFDTAQQLNLPLQLTKIDWSQPAQEHQSGKLYIEECHLIEQAIAGQLSKANAPTILATLTRASELALDKQVDAIVTAPVHKANLNQFAPSFLGHTEFFAELANIDKVVMMLATNELRVSLATTHLPLASVSEAVTEENLSRVLEVILDSFKRLALNDLKVAVCGLNPHAGEEGLLGHEDHQVITPVIKKFQQQGKNVFGPFPADTLFTPQKRKEFDLFLAMYHDQGLPVVKAFGFGQCVNVTLGLPYVRTSVDHGTALDIAADYKASADSLEYAINYATQMAEGKLP